MVKAKKITTVGNFEPAKPVRLSLLEKKITCLENKLIIINRLNHPGRWAEIEKELGWAYSNS